jgi:hypothetical protein
MVDKHHDLPGAGDGLCNGIVEQASRAKSRREDYNGKPEVGAFRRLWARLKRDELDRPAGKSHCAVYVGVVFGCCGGQVVYLLETDFAVARGRRSKSSDFWSSGSKMCLGTEIGDACFCVREKTFISLQPYNISRIKVS